MRGTGSLISAQDKISDGKIHVAAGWLPSEDSSFSSTEVASQKHLGRSVG